MIVFSLIGILLFTVYCKYLTRHVPMLVWQGILVKKAKGER